MSCYQSGRFRIPRHLSSCQLGTRFDHSMISTDPARHRRRGVDRFGSASRPSNRQGVDMAWEAAGD